MFSVPNKTRLIFEDSENTDNLGLVVPDLGHDPVDMPVSNGFSPYGLNEGIERYCSILAHDSAEHLRYVDINNMRLWLDPYASEIVAHGIIAVTRPHEIDMKSQLENIALECIISNGLGSFTYEWEDKTDSDNFDTVVTESEEYLTFHNFRDNLDNELGDLSDYIDYESEKDLDDTLKQEHQSILKWFSLGMMIARSDNDHYSRYYDVKQLFMDAYGTIITLSRDNIDLYGAEFTVTYETGENPILRLDLLDKHAITETADMLREGADNDLDDTSDLDLVLDYLDIRSLVWEL